MKKAQSLIEYVLILVLISMIAITTLHFLGKRMSFSNKEESVNNSSSGSFLGAIRRKISITQIKTGIIIVAPIEAVR